MSSLEKYLTDNGILIKFLTNYTNRHEKYYVNIDSAFFWGTTPEGHKFWSNHCDRAYEHTISHKRVLELKEIYKTVPPRYKEIV